MTFSRAGFLAAAVFAMGVTSASAENASGRYAMREVADGLLRLDTQTGSVSHCRKLNTAWTCEAVADDRIALQDEITRLQNENDELRRKLGENRKQSSKPDSALPTDEDLDKVMGFMERFMRRFFDFAKSLRDSIGEQV